MDSRIGLYQIIKKKINQLNRRADGCRSFKRKKAKRIEKKTQFFEEKPRQFEVKSDSIEFEKKIAIKKEKFEKALLSTQRFGSTHSDTKTFDTTVLLEDKWPKYDPFAIQVTKIKYHFGTLMPAGVVNGIQFTFYNLNTNEEYTTPDFYGNHQYKGHRTYTLASGEYINSAVVHSGGVVDGLFLRTTKGKELSMGAKGGSKQTVEFSCDNPVVIGFFGGFGGHLHNIGFYYASKSEIIFHRRRLYLLMAKRLRSNKDVTYSLLSNLQNDTKLNKVSKKVAIAFLLLSVETNSYAFSKVIQYIC